MFYRAITTEPGRLISTSTGISDILLARCKGAPILLRNNADGTFSAQPIFPGLSDVRAFAWLDLDNDGAADVALLDASGHLHIFMNQRKGVFAARAVPDRQQTYCALAVADVNDDGVLDLIVLYGIGIAPVHLRPRQGRSLGCRRTGEIRDAASPLRIGTVRLLAMDLDNNGAIDLVLRTPSGGTAWLADGKGGYVLLPAAVPRSPTLSI